VPDEPAPAAVTQLLIDWSNGDENALRQLIPLVHEELRRVARRHMAHERAEHTLQATALVNEAYMRLVDVRQVKWQNRAHFFAMSARLMRRILVDFARSRRYQKRGGGAQQVSLQESMVVSPEPGPDLVRLDEALTALAAVDERKAQVVEMRFFAGLAAKEIAVVLKTTEATVRRDWVIAKAWLFRYLEGQATA